ncbi:MAG TPA: VOC family protein [Gammaproteobacteria bacterium]|jgi:catechol 2,3-dioxygenase-like lactoylglutathione lyase family enzyme|nr:VOC family protein [Gammaproteobacteria bacterium]
MLDHVFLSVSHYEKSKAFYLKALASIGYHLTSEHHDDVAGFGIGKKPYFIIHGGGKQTPRFHIAFRADNRKIVDAFYKAAIEAGGVS